VSTNLTFVKWDFSILKEDWSRFRISDGTQLKVRVAVTDIYRSLQVSNTGYPELQYFFQNLVSVMIPDKLRGNASNDPINLQSDIPEEIKFEEIDAKEQEYLTTDGFKVLIKPVLQKVFKYNKYNPFGEPIYQTTIHSIPNIEKIRNTQSSANQKEHLA
jgi:hypothetical protein